MLLEASLFLYIGNLIAFYSFARIAFDSSSYPGLFSKANIFFLYASTTTDTTCLFEEIE